MYGIINTERGKEIKKSQKKIKKIFKNLLTKSLKCGIINTERERKIPNTRKVKIMTVYTVTYTTIDWRAYFMGDNNYYTKATKTFATREKAEAFKANELKEFVATWNKDAVVKDAGDGEIREVEVE